LKEPNVIVRVLLSGREKAKPGRVLASTVRRPRRHIRGFTSLGETLVTFHVSSLLQLATPNDLKTAGIRATLKPLLLIEDFEGDCPYTDTERAGRSERITYLKEMPWKQDNILIGENGIAALTFAMYPFSNWLGEP
jgi:hypothetical protein